MIKDLRDARLVDAVPRVVAGQDWVRALSEAVGVLHERTLRYIDDSQIYTGWTARHGRSRPRTARTLPRINTKPTYGRKGRT